MRRLVRLAILLAGLASAFGLARSADEPDISAVVAQIRHEGDAALAAYIPENGLATSLNLSRLYFDVFEGSGMEAVIGRRDHTRKAELEARFSTLIGLTARGRPGDEVATAWATLRTELERAADDEIQARERLRILAPGAGLLLLLALGFGFAAARGRTRRRDTTP